MSDLAHFFLRLISRAGLCLTLIVWWLSQSWPVTSNVTVGATNIGFKTSGTALKAAWVPIVASQDLNAVDFPFGENAPLDAVSGFVGLTVWNMGRGGAAVQVEQWFACTVLLIVTITTSRPWRQPRAVPPQAATQKTDESTQSRQFP